MKNALGNCYIFQSGTTRKRAPTNPLDAIHSYTLNAITSRKSRIANSGAPCDNNSFQGCGNITAVLGRAIGTKNITKMCVLCAIQRSPYKRYRDTFKTTATRERALADGGYTRGDRDRREATVIERMRADGSDAAVDRDHTVSTSYNQELACCFN